MLTLFPNKSFVKNIGMDNSGENCNYTTVYDSKINVNYNNSLKKIIYYGQHQIRLLHHLIALYILVVKLTL